MEICEDADVGLMRRGEGVEGYDLSLPLALCIAKAPGAGLWMHAVGYVPRCGVGLYTDHLHRLAPLCVSHTTVVVMVSGA